MARVVNNYYLFLLTQREGAAMPHIRRGRVIKKNSINSL